MGIVIKAAQIAAHAHRGQYRKWPDQRGILLPYISHPARVAGLVTLNAYLFSDQYEAEQAVAAAWLHDVVEDCKMDTIYLYAMFEEGIADLVMEMTNQKCDKSLTREEQKKRNRIRLHGVSPATKIIKACDRIDNLRDAGGAPRDFISKYMLESRLLFEECLYPECGDDLMEQGEMEIQRLGKLIEPVTIKVTDLGQLRCK